MDSNRVVIIGDINCDMLEGNRVLGRYDIKQMIADYTEFMEDHRFTLMNHKPTRHWPGTPSTLIDHVVTNQPMNIDNVITKPTHISDHEMVSCNYHVQRLKERPKTIKVRDYTLLTRQNIMEQIMENERLNRIFSMNDVDAKWELLIEVYNEVINNLAPSKLIQVKDDQVPFMTEEVEDETRKLDAQLTTAIESKDIEE